MMSLTLEEDEQKEESQAASSSFSNATKSLSSNCKEYFPLYLSYITVSYVITSCFWSAFFSFSMKDHSTES